MSWQFLYITCYKVEEEIKDYPEDYDYDDFISISDNLEEACREFDVYADEILCCDLWNVDPDARNTETNELQSIFGMIKYEF
jgi:hypothetical protein